MEFEIKKDPRSSATNEDLQAQYDFLVEVREKLTETHTAIKKVRDVRTQLESFSKRIGDDEDYKDLREQAKKLNEDMSKIEKELYQTKNQSGQDPLNYPIKLNNRLSALVGVVAGGDNAPTAQAVEVRDELVGLIDEQLTELNKIFDSGITEFNDAVANAMVPAIFVDQE